jgi:hypothetical protein
MKVPPPKDFHVSRCAARLRSQPHPADKLKRTIKNNPRAREFANARTSFSSQLSSATETRA